MNAVRLARFCYAKPVSESVIGSPNKQCCISLSAANTPIADQRIHSS